MKELNENHRGKTEAFLIAVRTLQSEAAKAGLPTDLLDRMREDLENATVDPANARQHVKSALNKPLSGT